MNRTPRNPYDRFPLDSEGGFLHPTDAGLPPGRQQEVKDLVHPYEGKPMKKTYLATFKAHYARVEAADDIKRGDKVISFHQDPDLPHFIIGQIVGTQENHEDGTMRYILKGEYDVNTRGEAAVRSVFGKLFYPPVNGTTNSMGETMNNVKKIG